MNDRDLLQILLRVLVYIASVAAAGGLFLCGELPACGGRYQGALGRQIVIGCCLLLLLEPVRYAAFQFTISGGDWSLAFGPDLRWIGMQTPMGQSAATRMIAAAAVAMLWRWSITLGLAAAIAIIGSFLLEGHSASTEARTALGTTALFVHLAAVHWWLGALYPLMTATRRSNPATLSAVVEMFGRRAVWIVAGLVAAGALLLGLLTGWSLRVDSAYQRRFLLKLGLVAFLLSVAAWNKLRLTPLLMRDHDAGAAKLGASIKFEMVVALSILATTAWATSTAPDE